MAPSTSFFFLLILLNSSLLYPAIAAAFKFENDPSTTYFQLQSGDHGDLNFHSQGHDIPSSTSSTSQKQTQSHSRNSPEPGVWVLARQKLFDEAKNVAVSIVKERFQEVALPDVTTVENVKLFGDVEITIENLTLRTVTVDEHESSITLNDGYMELSFGNVTFVLEGDFRYRQVAFPNIAGHGHAVLTGREGYIWTIPFFTEVKGLIVLSIAGAEADFRQVKLEVTESGGSWFYNLMGSIFKKNLKQSVCDKIKSLVQDLLPEELNRIFQTMPTVVNVNPGSHMLPLNVSFAEDPFVTKNGVLSAMWGLFQSPRKRFEASFSSKLIDYLECLFLGLLVFTNTPRKQQECPYALQSMTNAHILSILPKSQTSGVRMATLTAHVSILNCFTWALYMDGGLESRVHQHEIPDPKAAQILNTTTWESAIPRLAEMYPNGGASMDLYISCASNPISTINAEEGIVIQARRIAASFYVGREQLFTLSVDVGLGAILHLLPSEPGALARLHGELTYADVDARLIASHVGDIDMAKVLVGLRVAAGVATDKASEWLEENPIVVPEVTGVRIAGGEVFYEDGVVQVDADLEYTGIPWVQAQKKANKDDESN
ncbi:hypothetical protein HK102_003701 [Quaeritorhiza haematococci]|nr:hypothetical protein HK102_003701 [Quaeritorhiza haematococci]